MHSPSGQPSEDKRLTQVPRARLVRKPRRKPESLLRGSRLADAFSSRPGLLVTGTEGGLFAGSTSMLVMRFCKFAFFFSCCWGLFPAWCNYSGENAEECARRKEMLSRIERDPDWWKGWETNQNDPKQPRS